MGGAVRGAPPFVILDCSSLSPNLIESEPFGHAHPAAPPAATCASSGTTWSAARCSTSRLRPTPTGSERPAIDLDVTFRDGKKRTIAEYERRYVTELIRWTAGNLSRAARRPVWTA